MKCAACGYSDVGNEMQGHRHDRMSDGSKPFIEIFGSERGPGEYIILRDGWQDKAVFSGVPVKLYACPVCGTVKMEV